MKRTAASRGDGAGAHAIILTKGRTQILERCVATAVSTLPDGCALTVLDDSDQGDLLADSAVLREAARRSRSTIAHLAAESLHERVATALGGRAIWQSRTAARDIAPVRNLSLLLSRAVGGDTTVLIDDDVCHFDLRATVETVGALHGSEGVVAGATIGGTTELDTVTRLLDALCRLAGAREKEVSGLEGLFCASADDRGRGYGLASAGYTAFRLPSARLFAFPPGYNEDWLWCLLHKAEGKTRVLRTAQHVVHAPPALRRSSRTDILFEMAGDLVLDCLAEGLTLGPREPELALAELQRHTPHLSVMPRARAAEVLQLAQQLNANGSQRVLHELAAYGLGTLSEMERLKELDIDGRATLREWSSDALEKHRSFAIALTNEAVRAAMTASLQEGRY